MTATARTVGPLVLDIMARVSAAGVRLSPNGANLRFSAPGPLAPELRELLTAHKATLIAALSVWCPVRAAALQHETDGLVAERNLGADAEIAAAAARCVAAHSRQDMAGVRLACHEIIDRVKKLTAVRMEAPRPDLAEAREQGEAAAEECAASAARQGWDADAAGNAVLDYLRAHGPTPGEVLVTEASRANRPHDDRAFGAIFLRLSRAGLIEQAGHAKRAKGHGTAGGLVWRLASA